MTLNTGNSNRGEGVLSTLVKEFMAATRVMQSSSNVHFPVNPMKLS